MSGYLLAGLPGNTSADSPQAVATGSSRGLLAGQLQIAVIMETTKISRIQDLQGT